MPSLNKVTILGHLGREPEMRFTASGTPITTFSIATSYRYQQDGEWKEETTWHNIVAWGSLAERCNERLGKGSLVYVEGRLQNRSWEDRDGRKQYRTDVVASQVLFLERNPRPSMPQGREYEEQEDDLPF